jgi:competence protein ComEC
LDLCLGNHRDKNKVKALRALALMPLVALAGARGALFVWVPVMMGIGIGLWFAWPTEPGGQSYAAILGGLASLLALRRWGPEALAPVAMACACILLGMLAAGARAHLVDAPVLGFRYYGGVEGRIMMIDRSQSDHIRLTLDTVVLERTAPQRTPERVRISLHGPQDFGMLEPGQIVIATANLSPPEGPV